MNPNPVRTNSEMKGWISGMKKWVIAPHFVLEQMVNLFTLSRLLHPDRDSCKMGCYHLAHMMLLGFPRFLWAKIYAEVHSRFSSGEEPSRTMCSQSSGFLCHQSHYNGEFAASSPHSTTFVQGQGAKDAWDAVIRKLREGNADSNQLNVLTEEVERAFEAALNAGKALGFEEANRPAPNDVPNDATWRSDYNNGRYPFVEALVVIVVYFIGSTSFCYKHLKYYNNIADGNKLINAFYFVVVTTMTIGYGDIHPTTIGGRINTIFLVLAGIFISHMGDIVIGNFKFWLKKRCFASLIGWKKDVTLSISLLVAAAMCIGIGMVGILLTHEQHENHMCNTDSFYLSLLTLATVGYGDYHFKLRAGRGFATIWILFCYPLFRESSHFLVSRSIKLWRYITTELLKKWVQEDIPNTWNTWWPYVKDTLVPNSWQWVLHHLSTN